MSKSSTSYATYKDAKGKQNIECKQDANKLNFIHMESLNYKAGAHSV